MVAWVLVLSATMYIQIAYVIRIVWCAYHRLIDLNGLEYIPSRLIPIETNLVLNFGWFY